ncbi:receptor kinase-like protein Xa21 isoform X2 [Gossypium hirsutum]|uniref:Receptor kinase-like protein Xa21 isoform X2 n=1 Tax=Gossypium hirsutum TaxID=3635 RepID=A0ABM3A0Y9_GOSHI|nr:receptor kinase-like protein Xa21 isoform X2 [Gossypium hirsutum]
MNYNTCFHLLLALFIPCSGLCWGMTVRNLNSDQFALLEFKDRIAGPQNVLANNWTASTSVCNWIGVSCGILHKRVIALNLTSMNLRGSIPPHLGNLSFLLSLDLSRNHFYGHLPKELGQLHRLRILRLSYNRLNGEIPSWLGNLQGVRRLRMKNNNFIGTILETLVNMSNLQILNLGFNQLSGQIPSSIFNSTTLEVIGLFDNKLEGQIPTSIFNISSLKTINLFNNNLSGSLPNDMCQHLPKLEGLYLSWNELSGNIPFGMGKCNNLKNLLLSYNQFMGIIPRSIGNLTRLQELYLGFNNLEGQIPEEIGNLLGLEMLSIKAIKGLTGQIPSSIFNSTTLEEIGLFNNSLEGNLPPITNAPKLEFLFLWGNKLSGNIPNSISNASMLKKLELSHNLFSGPIPKTLGNLRHLERFRIVNNNFITGSATDHEWSFLSSLSNCRNLRKIGVSGNPLSGVLPTYIGNLSKSLQFFLAYNCELQGIIPMEIGNLTNLLVLELGHNKLSGFIPASIGGLRNLQGLNLSSNKLEGPIPESLCGLERLYKMYLGLNKLHGPIPSCLGNITSLGYLYLNSNKLSSAIPSNLWNLKDILEIDLSSNHLHNSHAIDVGNLRSLLKLNLSRNLLTGDILSTFGGLITLVSLDLSNNILHGHIPESFAGLISLEFLDLCNNNLSGVIPKSLEKLLYLKYFNVSFNRLEGEIPSKGCFSNFSSTSFMNNCALCGPPRLLVPPCKNDIHKNSQMIILHAFRYGLPTIGIVLVLIVLTIMYRRCQRSTALPVKDDLLSLKTLRRISHAELSRATNGFEESNMLGSGSFGYVYKGRLSDGMEVAIKVFNLQTEGAFRSFDIECDAMLNIVHRNIVKVITYCSSVDFKALVLDYMSNGNLEKWLHSENCFLGIIQRVDIMIDVAVAIEHLHNGHPTPIIHCDIKPSNILLDEDMVAHVGDFGVAKLLGEGEVMKQTMTLATIGYMAPEFGSAGIVSIKSDVYSYGIVLIETFTKKKPTDKVFVEEESIRHWMERSLPKGAIEIADVDLLRREDEYIVVKANCISSIMELALNCSAELPEERKDMKDVVVELKKIKQRLLNNIQHF